MIGAVLGKVGSLVIDLTIEDEKAKRAAKATMWGAISGVAAATGVDAASAAVGAIMVAKEVGSATLEDSVALAVLDASANALEAGVTGNVVQLAGTVGGSAAAGAFGVAVGGKDGFVKGLSIGGGLAAGEVDTMLEKTAGMAVGGSVSWGVATSQGAEDPGAYAAFGAQMGARLGAGVGDVAGGASILSLDHEGSDLPAAVKTLGEESMNAGITRLAGEGAGVAAGLAIQDGRRRDDKGDFIGALQLGSQLGAATAPALRGEFATATQEKTPPDFSEGGTEATASTSATDQAAPIQENATSGARFEAATHRIERFGAAAGAVSAMAVDAESGAKARRAARAAEKSGTSFDLDNANRTAEIAEQSRRLTEAPGLLSEVISEVRARRWV